MIYSLLGHAVKFLVSLALVDGLSLLVASRHLPLTPGFLAGALIGYSCGAIVYVRYIPKPRRRPAPEPAAAKGGPG